MPRIECARCGGETNTALCDWINSGGEMKRIRYDTMNSWNACTAPAYNLKVHKVIPRELVGKVLNLMECEDFYEEINHMIHEFGEEHGYAWQAGFNGRSGGYLVLYKGGTREGHKSICRVCGQRNFKTTEETGGNKCGKCGANARENKDLPHIYTQGVNIEDADVPTAVLKAFRKLAVDIVAHVKDMAKSRTVWEEEYSVRKVRKVLGD